MMIKTSSRNGDWLAQRRLCPCGDNLCYISTDVEDEPSFIERVGPGDSYLVGGNHVSSEVTNAVPPPFIGQSFQSDEEALAYYSNFARSNGFSVRRERSKGNPEHPMGVYKRELVCHRAGPPLPRKTDDVKRQRSRKASRCKCEAQMVIKKSVSAGVTRWVVINFSNVHNHEFMDSTEVPYPSPHQNISATDRDRILALAKNGCADSLILRALELEKGLSPGKLAFGERDIKTFLQAFKCINRDTEGMELLKVCRAMKEKNPDFQYEYTSDDNNKLGHVAWSYASSIRAFKVFGDVVVLDTTFHLSAYNRPVGVWFGIDNYGHTIFFCCVILIDEKPESLTWALQAFLRLMDGKFPQTIMTDLDMRLKDAISINLPNVKHAFCIWHVISKLPSWFSTSLGSEFDRFRSEFQRLYDSESTEEFEHQWSNMVMGFGLGADKHASLLYSHRFYWVLPYLQGWFFGGLLTIGRALSIQSFFKGFLDPQTRLKDFMEQVGVAVDFQNQAGEEATTQQSHQDVSIKTCMPMEEHASTILSRLSFLMFQKEVMSSVQFAVYETAAENYLVRHHMRSSGGHLVSCVPSDEDARCSCKGFETTGILCRHALRVLSLKNCFFVPDKYLPTRWRRESSLFPKSSSQRYRSQALRSLASIMIQESAITKERFDYVEWHLSRLLDHVRGMPALDVTAQDMEPSSCFSDTVDIVTAPSVTRGRPRKAKQALKNTKELHALALRSLN